MAGTMVAVTGATVDTTDQLTMAAGLQKAFVANGAILGIVDFANTKLTLAALTTPPAKGDILTQATSGAAMVVDFVDAAKTHVYGFTTTTAVFNTTNTVSSNNAGATMNPATFTPSAVAEGRTAPHWYSWTKYAGSTGDMPSKAYLVAFWRGRAILSGNPAEPHQWYMSRQFNPFDWTYAENDAQGAIRGGNADAGQIGDIVRALVPRNDDYMLFGCNTSIWIMQGDPCSGGQCYRIEENTGIYGSQSWCWDADGNLWFWGDNGIYKLTGGKGPAVCMSLVPLPRLVADENVDPSTHRITMGLDPNRGGIFISITKLSDGTNSCYWYDTRTKGFFPETYPALDGAYSLLNHMANDPDDRGLLVGCTDGYIRQWSTASTSDDVGTSTQAIDSKVLLGPIVADPKSLKSAVINDIFVEAAGGGISGSETDSSPITVNLFASEVAEKLLSDVAAATPTVSTVSRPLGPRVTKKNYRLGGRFFGVQLRNDTLAQSWSAEEVILDEGK
jgi:hypothetical protein